MVDNYERLLIGTEYQWPLVVITSMPVSEYADVL